MTIQRIAAFTTDPAGGNPAGVSISDTLPSPEGMLTIAADIGYSETVFAAPIADGLQIKYFSRRSRSPVLWACHHRPWPCAGIDRRGWPL